MEATGRSALRAKYLDWCSARLAERFLDLSPEEIYALARPDPPGSGRDMGGAGEAEEAEASSGTEGAGPGTPDSPDRPAAESALPPRTTVPRGPAGRPPSLPRPTDAGYRVLVQRVTEALLRRTSLPTFDQWSEAYAEAPERFDAELLGFWKDAVPESDADGPVEEG